MHTRQVWRLLRVVVLSLGSALLVTSPPPAAWALPQPLAPVPRLRVTVTAYSQAGPTASGRRGRPGMVALSRDVERALGVTLGEPVVLEGLGTFAFHDRMAARHRRRADLFVASPRVARRFGVTVAQVRVVRLRTKSGRASHRL